MRFIITLSCWCNAVDSFVKDDYSLALDTGIDIHNSYNRKVWCLSDLEHSVTFISHSAESLLSPHISCPLTQYSGLIPWPQICLGYLFPSLSLSLSPLWGSWLQGEMVRTVGRSLSQPQPRRLLWSKEPTSRLSPGPSAPVMWEKPGRVSHWVGSRSRLQTCHHSPLSRGNSPADSCFLKMPRFMSVVFLFVFLALLLHLASDQTESTTHVAVGVSEVWNAPVSCDFLLPLKKICVNICLVSLKQSRETDWHSFDSCSPPLNLWSNLFF